MKKHLYFGGLLVILTLSLVVFGQTQVFESLRLRGTGKPGTLVIANEKNAAVIVLRGSDGVISSGGNGTPGKLRIANDQNVGVISLDGATGRLSFIGDGGIRFADGTIQTTAPIQDLSIQPLLQRIQQLEARVTQLDARLTQLDTRFTDLSTRVAALESQSKRTP